jgi:NADPH-dependent 2,4-dienoyl-CoA reductase/sulfur reductase-like enzyme
VPVDVAIIGAGPYGMGTAAAVRKPGTTVSVFGEPMSFWERMPAGMLLRSPYVASSIGDPGGPLSLDAFAAATGTAVRRPIPLEQFVEYGRWFQAQAVPDLDTRQVRRVEREDGLFHLILEDGTDVETRRLVVAAGIGFFPRIPSVFQGLPATLVSHASAHRDLTAFSGRRVLVVGAGQSALESAALLAESGAQVQIVARATTVHWLRRHSWLRHLGPISSLVYAPAEVGPPLLSRLVEAPNLVRCLPSGRRGRLDRRSIRPAGAGWLRERVIGPIPVALGHEVVTVDGGPEGLRVGFGNGADVTVDHVLLGTGYRVDLSRYPFLSEDLLSTVQQVDGYPRLGRGFESSVPGLHFLGAPAASTFGPLMRFVAGTGFSAMELHRVLRAPVTQGRRRPVAAAV